MTLTKKWLLALFVFLLVGLDIEAKTGSAKASPAAKAGKTPSGRVSVSLPEKLGPGTLELRPYPRTRELAQLFLQREESKAAQTLVLDGHARSAQFETELGLWQLIYRDGRDRRLEIPLLPLKADRDLGELAAVGGEWQLRILDEKGAPVAGAFVAQRPLGFGFQAWRPAFRRFETGLDGRVSLPVVQGSAVLWVLAPGFEGVVQVVLAKALPPVLRLTAKPTHKLKVVGPARKPLASALVASAEGVPLGFTNEAGELEGPFADKDLLEIEDAQGRRFSESVVLQRQSGTLRVQVSQGGSLQGVVRNRRSPEEPVPFAWVWPFYRPERWQQADAKGQFEIFEIWEEDTFGVKVDAVGFSARAAEAVQGEPFTIELDPADRQLYGRVRDEDGAPVKAAQVKVVNRGKQATWLAETNDDGEYRLRDLPYEQLWAEVARAPYFPAYQSVNRAFPEVWLDFDLELGATVKGRVFTSQGQPLEGVAVLSKTSSGRDALPLAQADVTGSFQGGPLQSGAHHLIFKAPGRAQAMLDVVLPKGERQVDVGNIELEAEERWTGRVVDEKGKGLAGARIFAWREENREFDLESPPPRAQDAISGENGGFEILGFADKEKISLEIRVAERPAILVRNITLDAGSAGEDWAVPLGASLVVEVVDSLGNPVNMADVTLISSLKDPFGNFTWTGREGKALYRVLPAGNFDLKVVAKNFGVRQQKIELADGEKQTVRVVLGEEGSVLEGRISRPDGQPASGFQVYLDTGEGWWPPRTATRTDEEGFYRFEGLATGNWQIMVAPRADAAPMYRHKVAVLLPQNQLDIALPPSSDRTIEVRVVTADARPLAGVAVYLYRKSGEGRIHSTGQWTDFAGGATFSDVPEGTYELMAWAPDKSWKSAEATVKLDAPNKEVQMVLEQLPELQ